MFQQSTWIFIMYATMVLSIPRKIYYVYGNHSCQEETHLDLGKSDTLEEKILSEKPIDRSEEDRPPRKPINPIEENSTPKKPINPSKEKRTYRKRINPSKKKRTYRKKIDPLKEKDFDSSKDKSTDKKPKRKRKYKKRIDPSKKKRTYRKKIDTLKEKDFNSSQEKSAHRKEIDSSEKKSTLRNPFNPSKITPCVDLAFKKLFFVEENKDLLISLINSIVSLEDQVVDLTLVNPYNPNTFFGGKVSILDIKAIGSLGKRFNIEMQVTDEADYDKRALYYWAKLYTEQLLIKHNYSTLNKTIGIHILNFVSIPETDKYHNVFRITEKDSGLTYFKDLELHTIELNKFTSNPNEELPVIIKKVRSTLDMWVVFLTRHDLLNKDDLPKELDNDCLKKALNVLDGMSFNQKEQDLYEYQLKWLRIQEGTLKKYEAKAEARGKAKEKAEIAKNLKQSGIKIDIIVKVTGLTKEQIEKL